MAVPLSVIQGGAPEQEDNFYYEVAQMKPWELLDRLDTIMEGCQKHFYMDDGGLHLEYNDPVTPLQVHNADTLLTVAGVRHYIYPWGVSVELYGSGLEFVGR